MNRIEFGHNIDILRRWAEQGIKAQTCVTSPPYFGLRSYLPEYSPDKHLEIGLEETPDAYVSRMVDVFRAVREVLADDGVLWINLGDSYGAGKQLLGIPWRVALALQADGWVLRSDIIWEKPNALPESVKDRCTRSHEHLFMFSKQPKYFFDSFAIQEPVTANATGAAASFKRRNSKREQTIPGQTYGTHRDDRPDFAYNLTRNRRDVWRVATKPYTGAHFAVFPSELIEPCILSGTSARGHCSVCGSRWVREIQQVTTFHSGSAKSGRTCDEINASGKHIGGVNGGNKNLKSGPKVMSSTTGWHPTCGCAISPAIDIVLDPFMGSGTTAAVALQHGRQYLGCEINKDYQPLQEERIRVALERLSNPSKGKQKSASTSRPVSKTTKVDANATPQNLVIRDLFCETDDSARARDHFR